MFQLIDVGDTLLKGGGYFAGLGPEYIVVRIARLSLGLVAIGTRNEPFHAAFGVANVLYQLSWALRLYEKVG